MGWLGPGKPRGRRRGNGKSFGGLGGRGLSALLVIVGPFFTVAVFVVAVAGVAMGTVGGCVVELVFVVGAEVAIDRAELG